MSSHLKIFLLVGVFICASFHARSQELTSDSLQYKSYLKIAISPIIYYFNKFDYLAFGAQYERRIGRKTTMGLSALVVWGSVADSGIPTFQNSKQTSITLVPQFRYYVGKRAFKGFYVGFAPSYYQYDFKYERRIAVGTSLTTGYQFFIARKFPVDINLWPGVILDHREEPGYNGSVQFTKKIFFDVGGDIFIGLPLGKKK